MVKRILGLLAVLAIPAGASAESWHVGKTVGFAGLYRPGRWVPVVLHVQMREAKHPLDAAITFSSQQDSMNRMTVTRHRAIEPNDPIRIPVCMKLAFPPSDLRVQIADRRSGRVRDNRSFALDNTAGGSGLRAVPEHITFVGVCGSSSAGLAGLQDHAVGSGGRRMVVARCMAGDLPWDWTGYDALDVLVLHEADFRRGVNDYQQAAIAEWVRRGGRLVLLAAARPLPSDGPIAELIPATFGAARAVRTPTGALLAAMGLAANAIGAETARVSVRPTALNDPSGRWRQDNFSAGPVAIWGPAGLGHVTVAPLAATDLIRPDGEASPPLAKGAAQLGPFWLNLLNRGLPVLRWYQWSDRAQAPVQLLTPWQTTSDSSADARRRADNAVVGHLLEIPELRPLSIWWIIGLLAALAVVVGPLDFFLLKLIDRQPWTWLTTGAVVVVFTAGAWIGVERIRGGALQTRVVSVCDAADANATVYVTRYTGIFAPSSKEYRIEGAPPGSWWSGLAPAQAPDVYYNESDWGARRLYFTQGDTGNLPRPVPINIWSMQCLIDESHAPPRELGFSARIRRLADGSYEAEVINLTDRPITHAVARVGDGMYLDVGRVEATSSRTVQGRLGHAPIHNGYYASAIPLSKAFGATASAGRSRVIRRALSDSRGVVEVQFAGAPLPFDVEGGVGTVDHVKLARLLVDIEE